MKLDSVILINLSAPSLWIFLLFFSISSILSIEPFLIESKYKNQLNNIVEEQFYKGLGMENLGYLPLGRIKSNRIVPTEFDYEFRSQLLKGYVHDMGSAMQGGVSGHAGLFSNANDLAKDVPTNNEPNNPGPLV